MEAGTEGREGGRKALSLALSLASGVDGKTVVAATASAFFGVEGQRRKTSCVAFIISLPVDVAPPPNSHTEQVRACVQFLEWLTHRS